MTDPQSQALSGRGEGKHTPTPWRLSESDSSVILADDHAGASDVPYAVAFCEPCVPLNGDGDGGQFNAAQIVRAMNAHDDLVAALQAALPFVAGYEAEHESNAALGAYTAGEAALAKATAA